MSSKKDRHYVNGPKLHQAIKDWYESGEDEIPMVIATAIMQICSRLGTKYNFKNYTYIDEMINEAEVACFAAVRHKKYDPYAYENPFAYFTMIAYNEFRKVLKQEQKETYIKHESLMLHMIDMAANGDVIELNTDDSGRIDNLVAKFNRKKDDNKKDRHDADSGESKEHSVEGEPKEPVHQ